MPGRPQRVVIPERPTELLLRQLRGHVEMFVPFHYARKKLGIDDATDKRWRAAGEKLLAPGDDVDDPFAEYARVARTSESVQITELSRQRGRIIRDPKHPQQLRAIEGAFTWIDAHPDKPPEEVQSGLGITASELLCLPPHDAEEVRQIGLQARELVARVRAIVARNKPGTASGTSVTPPGHVHDED